ncbi:hypothetical protein HDV62DRAFT_244472 [Trichoderma sp. SZMC 28011]
MELEFISPGEMPQRGLEALFFFWPQSSRLSWFHVSFGRPGAGASWLLWLLLLCPIFITFLYTAAKQFVLFLLRHFFQLASPMMTTTLATPLLELVLVDSLRGGGQREQQEHGRPFFAIRTLLMICGHFWSPKSPLVTGWGGPGPLTLLRWLVFSRWLDDTIRYAYPVFFLVFAQTMRCSRHDNVFFFFLSCTYHLKKVSCDNGIPLTFVDRC